MNRDEKVAAVDQIAASLGDAEAIFAVDYRGISVPQAAELRTRLREAETTFSVVKNRLAKRAVDKAGTEGLDGLFEGPTALALVKGDPVTAAKAISTFSREHDVLAYKGGLMDGAPLDVDTFTSIARLPGLEVLHGQLVGLTASPLTGLVAGLGNMISGLARQLSQIGEKGLVQGEEPAPPAEEEAPAEEAPAEEEPPAAEEAPEEEESPAEEEPPAEEAPKEDPPAEEAPKEDPPEEEDAQ